MNCVKMLLCILKIIISVFIAIKQKLTLEYFYVCDFDFFLLLMAKIKILAFSEKNPLLMQRPCQTLPVVFCTSVCYFVHEVA